MSEGIYRNCFVISTACEIHGHCNDFTYDISRANEAITQALTLTHELIQALLAEVRDSIDCLFTLTDSVVSTICCAALTLTEMFLLLQVLYIYLGAFLLYMPNFYQIELRRPCWTC